MAADILSLYRFFYHLSVDIKCSLQDKILLFFRAPPSWGGGARLHLKLLFIRGPKSYKGYKGVIKAYKNSAYKVCL